MLENEEDWLYDSISRYKQINMFELEYPVHHLETTNYNSICVSCSNNRRHQLIELSLPLKLTSQTKGSEDLITNDTDLKIKCGTFTQAPVAHLKTLSAGHKAVVSHKNTQSITVYAFSSDNSDEIKVDYLMKCELKGPQLAVSNTELALTTSNTSPWLVMDLSSGKVTDRVLSDQLPSRPEESVSPMYLESRLVAFCHHSTGQVQLYDKRQPKLLDRIIGVNDENNSSLWSFASVHECSKQFTSVDHPVCFGMVSTNGTLNVYDSRNWTTPCASKNLGLSSPALTKNKPTLQLKFKPANKNWVSVSGFDANIYIYDLTAPLDSVFVHNGHKYVEGFNPETITTSHAWFPSIDDLIISGADNGTIQSWQFEDSRKLTS
ncbi:WD repeat-containing protein 73-like [Homalodisca vitripennis]|uniref:WD repeat-containing protein 73-like n=1 Tax=Homalodisca vitripennis TaxID=197043 RepID=UPI001EEBFC1C|nr:WD repeat-containing protein 73-like [Homalodisca vitripennis]